MSGQRADTKQSRVVLDAHDTTVGRRGGAFGTLRGVWRAWVRPTAALLRNRQRQRRVRRVSCSSGDIERVPF